MEEGDRDSVGCPEERARVVVWAHREGSHLSGRFQTWRKNSEAQGWQPGSGRRGLHGQAAGVPEPYWRGAGCAVETAGGLLWGATGIAAGRGP